MVLMPPDDVWKLGMIQLTRLLKPGALMLSAPCVKGMRPHA
jgi:hypothetical protein